MAVVWIPSLLRELTEGQTEVRVPGGTVTAVIDGLEAAYPGIKARLLDGRRLRAGLTVIVDGTPARLQTPVDDDSEVHVVPAMSGGKLNL